MKLGRKRDEGGVCWINREKEDVSRGLTPKLVVGEKKWVVKALE